MHFFIDRYSTHFLMHLETQGDLHFSPVHAARLETPSWLAAIALAQTVGH